MRWLVLSLSLSMAACGARPRPLPPAPAPDPLEIDAAALQRDDPKCARKVARSAHAYFRYTNRPFVDLVCDRYASAITTMPLVHAHGDAHLEQYAVAAEGRGLADYDASAVGPPVVDLARFATSLVLAAPDQASSRAAIQALLQGYEQSLEDPSIVVSEPAAATRIRARFPPTPVEWLDRVEKLILPMPEEERPAYDDSWSDFVAQMRERDPAIDPAFFKIKVGGRIESGIGSSHVEKFLVRIEGPSEAPDDDLVMEAKGLEPGSLGRCMRGADLDAMRVILGQAQISAAPQRFLAAVQIKGKPFYSHTWLVHYTELGPRDVKSGAELAEIAQDVGVQLGRGHAKVADPALEEAQRRALRKALESIRPTLESTAFELGEMVTRSWRTYLKKTNRVGWSRAHP